MSDGSYFFAGGGTGGHLYPAMAVAEEVRKLKPDAKIHFFISNRSIDKRIVGQSGFEYTVLPAAGFSIRPKELLRFFKLFFESCKIAREEILRSDEPAVIGAGGFVAAPVCWVGHRLKVPVKLLNVDFLPGKANKVIGRWADEVFVQFEETAEHFTHKGVEINIVGCPLRNSFLNPDPAKVKEELGLDGDKKILLITGASSGSVSINKTICLLLDKLNGFADKWQIVHLSGMSNYKEVSDNYKGAKIKVKALEYYDDMADLLAAADLVIGRSGAVSVAEYAAAGVASICMPYPHHKDRHQYLNAGKLVEAGAAIIVDDLPDTSERQEWLWEELEILLKDDAKRAEMKKACKAVAKRDAALKIAEKLVKSNKK
jgi:UDP-N-acetylglucosamine--N-acetylmuramyl-(pentapeptide) pyrophosphoryl-undecaprenol N-acetylglucosamine transferase